MWEQVDDVLDEVREQLQFRNVKSAEKLRQAFEHGDVDGSGALDTLELEECLSHAGVFMEKRKLNLLVRALDCNGDKRVQYEEFMQAFLRPLEGRRKAIVETAWRAVSGGAAAAREGGLPAAFSAATVPRVRMGHQSEEDAWKEFSRHFVAVTGVDPTAAVRESAFTDYYTDVSNGILHDDEFVALLEGTWHVREHEEEAEAEELQELQSRLYDGLLSKNDGVEQPAKTLRRIFAFFDTDGSGALSRTEFAAALERVGLYLRPRQCDAFFRRFDTDRSGFIDVEEFVCGVAPVEEDTYECMDTLGTHQPRLLPGATF